jgi:predicted RNA binding protein YcfA (HicA-like mRNA interferase family)
MAEFRDISQGQAVRAFIRLGGEERRARRGHAIVKMPNGKLLAIPSGTLKIGLLKHLIRVSNCSDDDFRDAL